MNMAVSFAVFTRLTVYFVHRLCQLENFVLATANLRFMSFNGRNSDYQRRNFLYWL